MLQIKMNIAPHIQVEVRGELLSNCLSACSELTECVGNAKCGNCGCDRVFPRHRHAGGYDYYDLKCPKCDWEFPLGMRQADRRLYPKGPWQPPYQGRGGGNQQGGGQPPQNQGYQQQPQQQGGYQQQPQQGYANQQAADTGQPEW